MKRLMLTISTLAVLLAGAEEPYLAENLTVWLRADMGVSRKSASTTKRSRTANVRASSLSFARGTAFTGRRMATSTTMRSAGTKGRPSLDTFFPMAFTVDADRLGSHALALDYSSSSSGPWSQLGTCEKSPGGEGAFPLVADVWQSGFHRVRKLKSIVLII